MISHNEQKHGRPELPKRSSESYKKALELLSQVKRNNPPVIPNRESKQYELAKSSLQAKKAELREAEFSQPIPRSVNKMSSLRKFHYLRKLKCQLMSSTKELHAKNRDSSQALMLKK